LKGFKSFLQNLKEKLGRCPKRNILISFRKILLFQIFLKIFKQEKCKKSNPQPEIFVRTFYG